MRNLLLLLGLSMLGVLLSASVALAQVRKLDDSDCGRFPSQAAAQRALDSPNFSGAAGGADVDANFNGIACDNFDFGSSTSSPTSSPTASPSATPTATASASAAGAAQYQYNSALPSTGGVVSPVSLLAIIPAILLVGGSLLSARLIRRS